MVSKIALRHQFHQSDPCGVRGIDNKAVTFGITGFAGLHPICLLDLKG